MFPRFTEAAASEVEGDVEVWYSGAVEDNWRVCHLSIKLKITPTLQVLRCVVCSSDTLRYAGYTATALTVPRYVGYTATALKKTLQSHQLDTICSFSLILDINLLRLKPLIIIVLFVRISSDLKSGHWVKVIGLI